MFLRVQKGYIFSENKMLSGYFKVSVSSSCSSHCAAK